MSTIEIELPSDRLDKASDWMNPILVKETRQALKSRQFVGTFMLLLVSSWLICVFGIIMLGSSIEYGSPSMGFFQAFYFALSVAVLIIVPFNSFRSLLTEQDSQTYELLSITSLSPRQIVWGKLSIAVVQVLVFYCAISPFIAFTSLLQGFDLFRTVVLMTSLMGISIFLSMFTLMLSTVAKNKQFQALATLFIFGGLIWAISLVTAFSYAVMRSEFAMNADFFWGFGVFWLVGISYFILFHQITVSQLMFEAGNKATGVRLIAMGQFLLVWTIVGASSYYYGSLNLEVYRMMIVFSVVHWLIFGFFISMERDYLSRRIRRDLPKSSLLRFFAVPFMPGGSRGYLLLLINLGILSAIVYYASLMFSSGFSTRSDYRGILATLAYMVIYFGIGCAGGRFLLRKSHGLRPAHTRTMMIVLFALGAIVPYAIRYALGHYSYYNDDYHIILITSPMETITEISSSHGSWHENIIMFLVAGVAIAILINLKAMLLAALEIIAPKRPQIESATEKQNEDFTV